MGPPNPSSESIHCRAVHYRFGSESPVAPGLRCIGNVAGDEDLKREGQHQQAQARLQESGEQAKDGFAKE